MTLNAIRSSLTSQQCRSWRSILVLFLERTALVVLEFRYDTGYVELHGRIRRTINHGKRSLYNSRIEENVSNMPKLLNWLISSPMFFRYFPSSYFYTYYCSLMPVRQKKKVLSLLPYQLYNAIALVTFETNLENNDRMGNTFASRAVRVALWRGRKKKRNEFHDQRVNYYFANYACPLELHGGGVRLNLPVSF